MMKEYILIVEDDNDINRMLKELLEGQGYETTQAFSGTEAVLYMERRMPDGVILDLMLPGMSGEELLRHIKTNSPDTAVVVASAKEEVQTRIELLKAGADDYIVKPFDTQELLARLEAVLRRLKKEKPENQTAAIGQQEYSDEEKGKVLKYKDIVMRPDDFYITVAGQELSLTKREYLILQLLMENPGKVFTKSNIYESVWNEEFLGEDNAVNVHISNIRQKLARIKEEESYIQTVWGIGFKLKA